MALVAKDWFGLTEDKRTRVHIGDGLKFINDAAAQKTRHWNVVVIDINSSDPNSDLWGPTKEFVDEAFLRNCKAVLDANKGIMVINLLCLSESLKTDILNRLKGIWSNVYTNKLPKNRNEIVFCTDQDTDALFLKSPFKSTTEKNLNPHFSDANSMDFLNEISKNLKIF